MKYTCIECGETFDEDEIVSWTEMHGLDYGGERWSGSPCCQAHYVDAQICDGCGEYISGEYVVIDDKLFCDNCFTLHHISEL